MFRALMNNGAKQVLLGPKRALLKDYAGEKRVL
jgi:hypothetical protein